MQTLFRSFQRILSDSVQTAADTMSDLLSLDAHFPSTPRHVDAALYYLRQASRSRLPDEILKTILYHADYDCLHFSASSDLQKMVYSRGPRGTPSTAYITTPSIDLSIPGSRIRHVLLRATGHDQGHVSDPNAGVWSWFELRRKNDPGVGTTWALNEMASRNWQDHELSIHIDDSIEHDQENQIETSVRSLISRLEDGDALSIVPMARFAGWQCHVQKAEIDVEVEIWR